MGKMSPETKAKIAAALKGRKKSAETRGKMSESAKVAATERWQNLDYQKKQCVAQIKSHRTKEYREQSAAFGRLASHAKKQ